MSEIVVVDIVYKGTIEPIHCEKVSNGIYRCLESCIFIDFINYGCEIEVGENGKVKFLGLFKKSPFQTFRYTWSKEIISSLGCEKMKHEIIDMGGYWESAMGGIFILHLPEERKEELERLLELIKAE